MTTPANVVMGGVVYETQDMSPVDAAMAALERETHAVSRGEGDSGRLVSGLEAALIETDSFARLLADDTFTGDDASLVWRQGAAEKVDTLRAALSDMIAAARAEPLDGTRLLNGLEATLSAERDVRSVHGYINAYQHAVREAIEQSSRVPCMRCSHRNPAGRSTCEACRFPLPSLGVERIETDVVGGSPEPAPSVFLERLDALLEAVDEEVGRADLVDFLKNLERLQALGGRQLDTLLARVPRNHDVVATVIELRARMEGVRQMSEAVRLSVSEGDLAMLGEFRHWLADQFEILVHLNERVEAACGVPDA